MTPRLPALVVLASLALNAPSAHAWSQHHRLTRAALAPLGADVEVKLEYQPFEKVAAALGFPSVQHFNEALVIGREFRYAPKLGEAEGSSHALIDVLATYSDEPDWEMDKELFDQYPALGLEYEKKYSKMGARTGTSSQGFRHMYYPGPDWRHLLTTFKIPYPGALGQPPERAAIFVDLSRRAREAGYPYWAARFLASALHYLEDVSQPFHASQTPSKRFFLELAKKGVIQSFSDPVGKITKIVSYYHFAFERFIGAVMDPADPASRPADRAAFEGALATSPAQRDPDLRYADRDAGALVAAMAGTANVRADNAGRISIRFFPPIPGKLVDFNPDGSLTPNWWKDVHKIGAKDSRNKRKYFAIVTEMFQSLGDAIRTLVTVELLGGSEGG
jgi:hypothetical protein